MPANLGIVQSLTHPSTVKFAQHSRFQSIPAVPHGPHADDPQSGRCGLVRERSYVRRERAAGFSEEMLG